MTTKRLTLAQAEQVSTLLNSTVGHHTEGKKVLTVSAFANDEQSQAGIQIKKNNSDKQLVVMGVDFSKQSVIIATGSDMAKRALQTLLEENHSSVFSSVKNNHIPVASYVAWEIVTNGELIDSLIDLYEGHTLKAGQKYLKQIPSSVFDDSVAQALSYLDLDDAALAKIGWLSERQVQLYQDKVAAIVAIAATTDTDSLYQAYFDRFDSDEVPFTVNALLPVATSDTVTVTAIDEDGNTTSVQVPKAKKTK